MSSVFTAKDLIESISAIITSKLLCLIIFLSCLITLLILNNENARDFMGLSNVVAYKGIISIISIVTGLRLVIFIFQESFNFIIKIKSFFYTNTKYREDNFNNHLWKWNWKYDKDKKSYQIVQLEAYCRICNTPLRHTVMSNDAECPRCSSCFNIGYIYEIQRIIQDNAINNIKGHFPIEKFEKDNK